MRIVSSVTRVQNPEIGMFDYAITFRPFDVDSGVIDFDHESYLNEICAWVVNSFINNFVVIEHADVSIAGGWQNNKEGWADQQSKVFRGNHARRGKYELRCSYSDAAHFLLKWGK